MEHIEGFAGRTIDGKEDSPAYITFGYTDKDEDSALTGLDKMLSEYMEECSTVWWRKRPYISNNTWSCGTPVAVCRVYAE